METLGPVFGVRHEKCFGGQEYVEKEERTPPETLIKIYYSTPFWYNFQQNYVWVR